MKTLPKNIYKRGNSYYVRYRRGGKWGLKSAGPELGAALELQQELGGVEHDPQAPRLQDLVERYLKRLETYGKASTVHTHKYVANNLIRFFRGRPVDTLTSSDLEAYIQERMGKVARSTINGELKNLKATLRFAVEEGLIAEMPFKIRMVPVVIKRTSRIFTREEIQRLLAAADERVRCLLLIASATAMRVGEIKHLKWSDINSAERRISVTAKEGWTPKTCHERDSFVSEEVIEFLTDYRARQSHSADSDWVLQDKLTPGKRWASHGNSNQPIIAAFKKAGLYQKGKLTHEIRRAVASTMLLQGTPIHVVKEILGHSSIKTTELYAFTNEEAKRHAAKNALV